VGRTPCRTAPTKLKISPADQITRNSVDIASVELRLKFSIICGEKTTIQQAIDIDPATPLIAAKSKVK